MPHMVRAARATITTLARASNTAAIASASGCRANSAYFSAAPAYAASGKLTDHHDTRNGQQRARPRMRVMSTASTNSITI